MRDALPAFVKRVQDLAEHVRGNEQATKQSLIGPLFTLLGYDLTDPRECVPEYRVDFGPGRSVKPIDWAFLQNGRPIYFVEAKEVGKKLATYDEQLADYFAKAPEARLGILTNGVQWRFFTDVENPKRDVGEGLHCSGREHQSAIVVYLVLVSKKPPSMSHRGGDRFGRCLRTSTCRRLRRLVNSRTGRASIRSRRTDAEVNFQSSSGDGVVMVLETSSMQDQPPRDEGSGMGVRIVHGQSFGGGGVVEGLVGRDQRDGAEAVRLVAAVDFERHGELHGVVGATARARFPAAWRRPVGRALPR